MQGTENLKQLSSWTSSTSKQRRNIDSSKLPLAKRERGYMDTEISSGIFLKDFTFWLS